MSAALKARSPDVDWASFSLVVCRSPWDYTWQRDAFVDWVHRVDGVTRLLNPAEVLIRNTDKTYLRDLAEAGVPVVPTLWAMPPEMPWPEVVVKPAVSAGSSSNRPRSAPPHRPRSARKNCPPRRNASENRR